jgi:APA family basic amino acid/polyamine antiporter
MSTAPDHPGFRRELGTIDAAAVVAGAIIGVGIFANPSNVARILGEPSLILAAWILGGLLALIGGFAYAELAARLPEVGGQFVYLARAYHPSIGFLYGVALLFIINGGALAAVAILFASYLDRAFLPLGPAGIRVTAAGVLLSLAAINALGVRAGKRTNNLLMAVKIAGILILMLAAFGHGTQPASGFRWDDLLPRSSSDAAHLLTALVPIMFAYGGWQNCGSIAGEIRDPARTLARANVLGVSAVVALYVGLNVAYLWVLTPEQIAASPALAADMARAVAGDVGARAVSALILISSLGFLAVITLTGPRLYYAMARDGLFFERAARLSGRGIPTFALWCQTGTAVALLASNTYDELLSYVVFADWLFFSLTAGALFVLRRRDGPAPGASMPGHPWTTLVFIAVGAGIVVNSFFAYTRQSLVGSAILAAAAAAYFTVVRGRRARAVP